VLFLADSHLGFDLPSRPRVERRRRGHDFLANHRLALAPARNGEVDLVVHGGDVFHRSRVPPSLVFQAFRPLIEVADSRIPVFVVPGNHERSRIPHERLAAHPNLHIFRRPKTFTVELRGLRLSLSGFPYERRQIREKFPRVLEETGWRNHDADVRLLCVHHCVEGATVGPAEHTFRHAPDVIRCNHLPAEFAAVLSGHIHRHQVLHHDLKGCPLPTPVLYPGSVERTAFAEAGEEKGFLLVDLEGGHGGGRLVRREFVPLPARPMLVHDLHPRKEPGGAWRRKPLEVRLKDSIAGAPRDAVLRVRLHGRVPPEVRQVVAAPRLRELAPPEMNLEVVLTEERANRRRNSASPSRQDSATDCVQTAHFPFGSD
jgi:DNA repair exonuclease SbcCD nuclease subunit